MQTWKPDLGVAAGPKYLAIAEALARDIGAGRLAAGDRLPSQRALADVLGVDLTTITRAFGEAQRRGLIDSDGRRGSFVRIHRGTADPGQAPSSAMPVDTGMNAPPDAPNGVLAAAYQQAAKQILDGGDGAAALHYQPSGGMARLRKAGAALLNARGIPCSEDTVLIAAGGQHALHAIVSAALKPGEAVGVGHCVYPGFLSLARRYGLRLVELKTDDEGIVPDALDAACRKHDLRALYAVPTNDNPTTATMGIKRRQDIAGVAVKRDIALIEDDAYGLLPEKPLPPLASFAPEQTWHIASMSKVLTPGLRIAFVRTPTIALSLRMAADLHETAIMAPPLNAAVVASWLESGTFDTLTAAVRGETHARQAIAAAALPAASYQTNPDGYHLWLTVADGINPADVAAAVRPLGLSVVPGDVFAVDRATAPHMLRVSIGGAISRDQLQRALNVLGALIGPDATRKTTLV